MKLAADLLGLVVAMPTTIPLNGNLTTEERGRFWESAGCYEIANVHFALAYAEEELEGLYPKLEKQYEVRLEQSEFRAQALTDILKMCDETGGTRKELVAAIKIAIENHGVEL